MNTDDPTLPERSRRRDFLRLALGASAVLLADACGPSPSRSRKRIATSASKKSLIPRGCIPISPASSAPVNFRSRKTVNTPNSTALSKTLEFQNPNAVCKIGEGSSEPFMSEMVSGRACRFNKFCDVASAVPSRISSVDSQRKESIWSLRSF